MSVLAKADAVQKKTKPTSVALATFKKFSEDQSTNLAAMVAFWAFFSIFPLLLVGITVLGWVLPAHDKAAVLTRVAEMFPLLNPGQIKGLSGQWWPVALGGVTALWSGLGVVRTLEAALSSVWEVPYNRRPGTVEQVIRALKVLGTVGLGLVLTTLISSYVTSSSTGVDLGVAGRVAGYVVAIVFDVGLLVAAFRMLSPPGMGLREVVPGAVLSGVVLFVLQELSAFIISRHLKNAQSTYGHFATVITILWWFYLQAIVTLLGAQLNVVLKERLYPRSLVDAPQTDADHRVLQAYAAERADQSREKVRAGVGRPGGSLTG